MGQVIQYSTNSMRLKKMKSASLICIGIVMLYAFSLSERRAIIAGLLDALSSRDAGIQDTVFDRGIFFSQETVDLTPKIAWLMSFPNSGTSFTMSLIARASNRSFATNYADEVTHRDITCASKSIYPDRIEGPFWPGMSGRVLAPRPLPDSFVLTKTHCGSRCMYCGPREYIMPTQDFLFSCASGHARFANRREAVDVHYPPERVKRAIHLIRNPFTNIVSRYHQQRKNQADRKEIEWLLEHPNNVTGFKRWCTELDLQFYEEEIEYFGLGNFSDVPCHAEFYKYAQWHSLVEGALELIPHPVPTLTVYYEDYEQNLKDMTKSILNFLELDLVGNIKAFKAKTDISEYFTTEERINIKDVVHSVASRASWTKLQRYF